MASFIFYMLINVSPNYLYWHGKIQPVHEVHSPYFLVFAPSGLDINHVRKKLMEELGNDNRILKFGEIEEYTSFWNTEIKRKVFKLYVKHPSMVPEMSNKVFNMGYYTAEHDIPYHERVLTDLAAQGTWIFDSGGKEKELNVTVYDIELTKFGEVNEPPIDIIGYAGIKIKFSSEKNLENEDFFFDFVEIEGSEEVKQLVANDEHEEIKNLLEFCKIVRKSDMVAGHNIMGFDNLQIYDRIRRLMQTSSILSPDEIKEFRDFLDKYTRKDQSFIFGSPNDTAIFYPSTFDTYLASRKFYSLEDFSLDGITNFLGVGIPDRLHLSPQEMGIDDKTLLYNSQDVIEEVRVTKRLIEQGLPLAFITGMPFELLFPAGATKMWDYMAMIRAAYHKKIMPPICRAFDIAGRIEKYGKRKAEIAENVRKKKAGKELLRVVKYGEEMPDWVEYPYLINDNGELGYHFPGGMTIKPDRDAKSHFIPWYHVIVADVGAMYPTILRAINAGGDTVRLALNEPDEWVWIKRLPERFLNEVKFISKPLDKEFMDKGLLIGVKISKEPGIVNLAMKGIMNFIDKIKKEMKEKQGEEKKRLKMIYQSLKAARNAGTHGILSAPMVACRQFNLWGAALITTKGQQILYDTLKILSDAGIRVVYGDTDGIYVACSRSASKRLRRALGLQEDGENWIVDPKLVYDTIEYCNKKWQNALNYENFELEPEEHDAMIFVKHKNYLIFDVENVNVKMITKGNNFKGSDKPAIARIVLKDIMMEVLKENIEWKEEEEAREKVKDSIRRATLNKIKELDIEKFGLDAFTLIQSVQPASRYKPNPDGSMSVYGERAKALEKLVGKLNYRRKFKFVITKHPLPGIRNPTKSGVKPIHYMYPVELLLDREQIDMKWYKDMIKNFIQGAFGLAEIEATTQYGLDRWM
ncbi:MAG: DNA polymerase elongation subunit (family B) [Thermoplasmata archaeon]|nr:DNA polymerase elongation subunit (family B) [Thermoplasmata archaeon]